MWDENHELDIPEAGEEGRVGVIDMGSNTLRLVVYDTPTRLPVPIYNEKAECALGKGLAETGLLNPDGIIKARIAMARFIHLIRAMGVNQLDIVATAAVRTAENGPAFAVEIEQLIGHPIKIVTAAEEAELAAIGLLLGTPKASGVLADLGGGSVDIIEIDNGQLGRTASLPLGHIRLPESAGFDFAKAQNIVADVCPRHGWIKNTSGRNLYLIGGTFRALARKLFQLTAYPLHVVDGYSLDKTDAIRLMQLIVDDHSDQLVNVDGVRKNRAKTIPYGAIVLLELIKTMEPEKIIFSGYSMREGQLIGLLSENTRTQDPLLAGAAGLADRTGRFSIRGEEIYQWMKALFPAVRDKHSRLRMASAMVSDLGWSEHPDYRAEHAFLRVLRLPFAGLTHAERVFLGLVIFIRYNGDPDHELVAPVRALLSDDDLIRADIIGRALRLAHTISGSAPGLLGGTRLECDETHVRLRVLPLDILDRGFYLSEAVERRLRGLAKTMQRKAEIV